MQFMGQVRERRERLWGTRKFWTISWKLIMSQNTLPDLWQAPIWHPDFGDPRLELDHLREFAIRLLKSSKGFSPVLETPEPGLMYVRVVTKNGTNAEVHSVTSQSNTGGWRYGIFISPDTCDEVEEYVESPDEAVMLLIQE